MKEKLSRELFTNQGKAAIIFIWTIGTIIAVYGCTQVEIDFKIDYFIPPEAYSHKYLELNDLYFSAGFSPTFYVVNPEIDFISRETQLKLIEFNERLERCEECTEDWFKANTLNSWYN